MPRPIRPFRRACVGAAAALVTATAMMLVGASGTAAQPPTTTGVPTDPTTEPTSEPTPPATDPSPGAPDGTVPTTTTEQDGATTTSPPTTDAVTTTAPASDPEEPPAPATTLPTAPPEGFSEEQFRTFVEVVTACGPEPGVVCSRVLAWTGSRWLAETSQWVADVPAQIVLILGLALLANWVVRRGIARYVARLQRHTPSGDDRSVDQRRTLRMTTTSTTLAGAATVLIAALAIVLALGQLDISLGPLLAGAGIVGVALGFGAQNVVRDVLAGFFVIVEDQYGIGDVIDVGRASGVVEGISLRVTKLRDVEGTLWFVPNGLVNEVGNLTQRWARVILDIGIAYGADHHRAERLIKEAADALWLDQDSGLTILEEPELWGVELLGDSSVTVRIAVTCVPSDQWAVARALRSRIKDRLDLAGIEIPFPQQAVWVRSEPEVARRAT